MTSRRYLFGALGLIAALSAALLPAAHATPAKTSYDSTIAKGRVAAEAFVKDTGTSSLSVALVDGSKVVWAEGFGAVDAAGTSPTPTTVYGIGSVSKMLAAVAVMQLVDQGRVNLDSPVVDYLPDFRMLSPEYQQITVRMLLNHSAGFPGTEYSNAVTTVPWGGYAQQVLDTLSHSRLKTTPGAMSVYSNDGFTVAGVIVERITGQSFPDYVTEHVLMPLGMTHSSYQTAVRAPGATAPVLTPSGPMPTEYATPYASGGLLSTPSDMGQLAAMLMNDGSLNGVRVLSPAAVREMGQVQTHTTLNPVTAHPNAYGLGWDSVEEPGLAAVGVHGWVKDGDIGQYHAAFLVDPEQKLAVIVQAASVTAGSSQLLGVAQSVMLNALADKGAITTAPTTLTDYAPAPKKPTARQLADIAGIYLGQAFTQRIVPTSSGAIRFSTLVNGEWVPSPHLGTMRADGKFWTYQEPILGIGLARGWGRTYLTLERPEGDGHYLQTSVLGQKVTSTHPLMPAWQARTQQVWLNISELPISESWVQLPVLQLSAIPGLPGYLWVTDASSPSPVNASFSNDFASMFVVVPTMQGRDLNDLEAISTPAGERLRFGGSVYTALDAAPKLNGSLTVTIGADGYAQWVQVPAAGTVNVSGASGWRLYGPDGSLITDGTTPATAPAGSAVVVFGSPGAKVSLSQSPA